MRLLTLGSKCLKLAGMGIASSYVEDLFERAGDNPAIYADNLV